MNSNYETVVRRIAEEINSDHEGGAITVPELNKLVSEVLVSEVSGNVNCYPGLPGMECYPTAFFISLTSSRYASPRSGHLGFSNILESFVLHTQGYCKGKTRTAVFIFDSWLPDVFRKWQPVIEQTRRENVHIEAFLIAWPDVFPLNLP